MGNPLLESKNKFKLGVFGVNVSSGCSMTDLPNTLKAEWAESVALAQAAERAGFEAIIPVARWKGMGGGVPWRQMAKSLKDHRQNRQRGDGY